MQTVAGLDNGVQSRFEVGARAARVAEERPREGRRATTPLVVFSHSPLYKYYRNWNFWTDDADEVQAILKPLRRVTVIHGHTHQLLTNRIGNIHFHGMLSTAWPWPYAPEGPAEADRADEPRRIRSTRTTAAATARGRCTPTAWSTRSTTSGTATRSRSRARYLQSNGQKDQPPKPNLASF